MFLTLKKSDIITVVMAAFIAVSAYTAIRYGCETIVVSALPFNGRIIVLDAGHGLPDGGAVSEKGTVEQGLNLDVALRLQHMLEQSGAYVIMTRADEYAVADNLDAKIRDIKRSDLKFRKSLKDTSGCDAFISIHMNKFEQSQYKGAQVFYAKTPDNSKLLGDCLQDSLIKIEDPDNSRLAKEAENSIFILKNSDTPSVLVECGFISNNEEERMLITDEYREKLAYSIYNGICSYFDKIKSVQ